MSHVLLHSLLLPESLPFHHLFIQQGLNTDTTSLRPEMTTESVSTGEPPSTSPLATDLKITLADELLLTRVQTLVSLTVMLSRKGFATYGTHERSLVGMGPQMRTQIVGASESLGAQGTLERSGVLLNTLGRTTVLTVLILWVCQAQRNDIIGHCRRRLSSPRRRSRCLSIKW